MRTLTLLILLPGCTWLAKVSGNDTAPIDLPLIEEGELDGDPVPDVAFSISLYDEQDSAYLPAYADLEHWGAVMLADAGLRGTGGAPLMEVRVDALSVETDAPLVVEYEVSSSDGVWLRTGPAGAPAIPEACHITVDVDTTAAQHGADVTACLAAVADASGGPTAFYLDVRTFETAATNYAFGVDYAFATTRQTEAECSGPLVFEDDDRLQLNDIVVEALDLGGYVAAVDHGVDVLTFANTYLDAAFQTGGSALTRAEAGHGVRLGAEIEVVDPVPSSVTFDGHQEPTYFPGGSDAWIDDSIDTMADATGRVNACWVVAHDALPNQAFVRFDLVGIGSLAD